MKLIVQIPCYNEEGTLRQMLDVWVDPTDIYWEELTRVMDASAQAAT